LQIVYLWLNTFCGKSASGTARFAMKARIGTFMPDCEQILLSLDEREKNRQFRDLYLAGADDRGLASFAIGSNNPVGITNPPLPGPRPMDTITIKLPASVWTVAARKFVLSPAAFSDLQASTTPFLSESIVAATGGASIAAPESAMRGSFRRSTIGSTSRRPFQDLPTRPARCRHR
jgi:hypothetical protein